MNNKRPIIIDTDPGIDDGGGGSGMGRKSRNSSYKRT